MTHRLAQFLIFITFVLLFMGGLVTSTDSGLAVPDWPLSFGGLFPPMIGGIRFEHSHRLVASTVGFITLILTIWVGRTEKRAPVRWLAIAALGAVVMQGILGGMTVLFRLPAPISVAHACLGPIFFCLVVSLAEVTSPARHCEEPATRSMVGDAGRSSAGWALGHPAPCGWHGEAISDFRLRWPLSGHRLAMTTVLSIFLQILLGAIVRHTGDFVWLHVCWALLVFFLVGFLVTRILNGALDEKRLIRPALLLGFLVTAEFFLGIGAFVFTQIKGVQPGAVGILFPTIHQTLGALILATSIILTIRMRAMSPCPASVETAPNSQ